MTFDQLEFLEMIVEKGSFKAAAKALGRTQPTMSVAIKKLEAEFGLTLFSRDEYRPKLTEAGRVFYESARQTLLSFRRLEVIGKEMGHNAAEPSLTVVIDPVARFEAIRAIFSECLTDMKATELILRSEIMTVGTDLVRKGEADFAVTPRVDEREDIESFPIERVDMIPVIAASKLTGGGPVSLLSLREQPQIIVASSSDVCDRAKRDDLGLLDGGKRCYVTDHSLKRRLIEEGFGWGRLARHEASAGLESKELIAIPKSLMGGFVLDLHVMRHRLRPMGPVARAVWSKLRSTAEKERPDVRLKK
jgi:DNA-binding transcriptional LysR family regulator